MASLVLALGLGILPELGGSVAELLGLVLNRLGSLEMRVWYYRW